MLEELSLRQLSYFAAAARTGTMTAAAAELQVSQSAVSLGVADLERQLGVQLLLRHPAKGLTLTAAGRDVLVQARSLLRGAEELRAGAWELGRSLRGTLVVGCFHTLGPFVLPQVLEAFHAKHPQVQLEFVEGMLPDLQNSLLDGRCELAVVYDLDLLPSVTYEPLYPARPYVLLAPSHPLAERPNLRFAELAEHDLVMLDMPPTPHHVRTMFAAAGQTPKLRHSSVSYELVRSLVARGLGYSILISAPVTRTSYEGMPLVSRPIADEIAPITAGLARTASGRPTRRAQAFAKLCRQVLAV